MNSIKGVLIIYAMVTYCTSYQNSIFYCGFSANYCGQSITDDVNPNISTIFLAFANLAQDGSIIVDQDYFPGYLVSRWQENGKDVILSVGGQNNHWEVVFRSEVSTHNFIQSVARNIQKYRLSGVDLDILSYSATPRTVANMIIGLKQRLNTIGRKLLIVSPEDVTIYQGVQVPSPDYPGQAWNYFVPIVQLADDYIDIYQPQAYNNGYDGFAGGSLDYFKDVYLNWRNMQGLSSWTKPIEGFSGIRPQKLRIGLLASPSAGVPGYYGTPETVYQLKLYLQSQSYPLKGFMIWDSHWDKLNQYAISNACQ